MKKIAQFAAILLTFAATVFAGPYDTWVNYRDVTINTTPTGANVVGTVTDFPVLVRLTSASPATGSDVLSGALAGGADLRFMSVSGAALSYQIERWSPTNAEIWVRVPVVTGNANTKIRMYWGNGASVTESNGATVFDTANGYKAVWHMNAGSATANESDASVNGFTLTTNGTATGLGDGIASTSSGPIGLARTMVGGTSSGAVDGTTANNNDWFQATGTASALEFGNDGTYTYSVWINPSDNDANRTLLSKSDNNSTVKMTSAPIQWEFTEFNQAGTQTNGWQGTNGSYSGNGVVTHIMGVRQGTSSRFYKDGVLVDSTIATSSSAAARVNGEDFVIGRQATSVSARYFAGTVDEVRVSKVARSASFAKLDYETQKAATTAVTLGTSLTTGVRYSYVVDSLVGTVGTAISNVTPLVNATGLVSASVLPALPAGLSLNTATGVISGTPTTASAATSYTVTAVMTGPDTTATATINIRVRTAALATFTYSTPDTTTYFTGVVITADNATVTAASGATVVDSFTVSPLLPAGLILNATTGQITGTPSGVLAAANYLVSANAEAGGIGRNLRLTVAGVPTVNLVETAVSYEGGLATPIAPLVPTSTGTIVTWSINPPLPAGLSFNTTNGTISGTPTAGAPATDYTISVTNPAGSGTDLVNITVVAPEDYNGWSTVKTLNLNTTAAAAGVTVGQTTFPVLVRLNGAHAGIFQGAASGGADIRFSKPDGTRLAYELDRWSFAPGDTSAAFWVQLDAVNASATTPIRIHYGNGAAVSKSDGSRVFNSNNGYVGVWHMGNPAGGNVQTGARPNSKSPGSLDAVPQTQNSPLAYKVTDGIIAKADTLPGGTNSTAASTTGNYFNLGTTPAAPVIPVGTFANRNATFSMWMKLASTASGWRAGLSIGNFGASTIVHNGVLVGQSGQGGLAGAAGYQVANGTGNPTWPTTALNQWPSANTWRYVTLSIRSGTTTNDSLYINGVRIATTTGGDIDIHDTARAGAIGRNVFTGDANLQGGLDEVRLANVARDRQWVKLEYKNQKADVTPVFDLAYAAPVLITSNSGASITPNVPTVAGTATRYEVSPALPAGLSLNTANGTISGAATTVSPAANYVVTAYGDSSWSTTATVNIEVMLAGPSGLSYTPSTMTAEQGLPAPALVPQISGGTVGTWSTTPALPAGLSINSAGVISGTPTASAVGATYTVKAANATDSVTTTVNITVTASESYAAWDSVKTFNVNTTAAGVTTGQGSVPVLVRLTSAHPTIFATAKVDGSDIRFSRPDGTRLAYQIERWNKVSQVAEIWVAVDTVFGSGITPIRIHWGNAGASSKSDGSRVFNRGTAFEGAWHFSELAGDTARDATLNSYFGVPFGAIVDTAGSVGRGKFFNNVNTIFYRMPTTAAATSRINFPEAGTYTVSAWLKVNATGTSRTAVSKSDNQYALELRTTGSQWQFHEHTAAGVDQEEESNATAAVWQHVSAVRNGASQALYINGIQVDGSITNTARAGARVTTDSLTIGKNPTANDRPFLGSIDEVQISSAARSADWLKLNYMTQKAASSPVADLAYSAPSYSFVEEALITPIAPPTLAGTATRFSISPALPPTLTFNTATGAISGTSADSSGTTTYTVTAFGDSSWSATTTFDMTVNAAPTAALNYPLDSIITYVGEDWGTNVPTFTGTAVSWSVNPALPAGMSLTSTGAIVGIPTGASPRTLHVVSATGSNGLSDTETVIITVAPAPEDFSTWSNSRNITINTSSSGANTTADVTGYPLLVRLGAVESSIFSQALASGADVRFTKSNGVTRLPHEIVSWDASGKTAEIWVKVDSVKASNSTQTIKMLWGKAGATDSSSGNSVFTTSNFVGVWHLGGVSDATPRPSSVSAAPGAILRNAGGQYTSVTGLIGTADNLGPTGNGVDGGTNPLGGAYLEVGRDLSYNPNNYSGFSDFTTGFSWSTWVQLDSVVSAERYVVLSNDSATSTSNVNRILSIRNGTTGPGLRWGTGTLSVSTPVVNVGPWHQLALSKTAGTSSLNMYLNGVLLSSLASQADIPVIARNFVYMGRASDGTGYLDGRFDEQRLAKAARSADWIKLDYESQKLVQAVTDIGVQPPTLAYAPDSATYLQGAPISTITPSVSGASVTYSGSLPAGLALNASTGVITGTPTAPSAKTKYTITATNLGGSVTDSIFIRVNPAAPTGMAYVSNSLTLLVGTAMTPDSVLVTNLVDSFTVVPSLPAGLSINPANGIISGTPLSVTASADYVITATNVTGTAKDTVTILVNPAIPVIAYATPKVYTVGFAIDTLAIVSTGGPVDSFTVASALPGGLSLDKTTGKITGTPTTRLAAADYSVMGLNVSGSDTAIVNITVLAPPVIAYATPKVYTVGIAIATLNVSSTGGPITGFTISPDLNAQTGLAFNLTSGAITGTPTLSHVATNYTVIATGPDGLDTAVVNIQTTNEIPPVIVYADSLVAVKGFAIAGLNVDTVGQGSGPIDSFTVVPALPAGLVLNKTTGAITGTPTVVAATTSYTVTATGLGGFDSEVIVITVNDIAPVVSYPATPKTYPVGTAIAPPLGVLFSSGGLVVKYTIAPDLTAQTGLVLDSVTGEITGTPTLGHALTTYVITATNSGGSDTGSVDILTHGAPVIATQPHDSTVVLGAAASFVVSASAQGTLSYQWKRGATSVGTNSATLSIGAAAITDTGSYTVVVTSTLNATTTTTTSTAGILRVNVAPTFTSVQRDTTIVSGTSATFSVVAATGLGSSAGTLSYQWKRGATNVGTNAATISLTGATIADTGVYTVVVTRNLGTPTTTTSATFTAGVLRVNAAPVVSAPRDTAFVSGATGTAFSVSASVVGGGVLSYQWKRGATSVGTNAATISLTGMTLADTGAYTVVVTSTLNGVTASTTSTAGILRVNVAPTFTSVQRDTTIVSGTNATFSVVAASGPGSSAGALSYQWKRGTTNVGTNSATISLTGATIADSGVYTVVVTRSLGTPATTTSATFTAGVLRVNAAPSISAQPRDTTFVGAASGTAFSVTASVVGGGTLSYQWMRGATNVGTSSATLSLAAVTLADTGAYTVVVTSTLNGTTASTTSTAGNLRVNVAPTFTSVQRDTTITSGTGATFSVVAAAGAGSSAGTLSYQWKRGATNVGTNAATISLTGAAVADTGVYSVVVTRSLGTPVTTTSATFTAGVLRVNAAPSISAQPRDTTFVAAASGTAFSVTASSVGGGVLSYQWKRGATNVGTSSATLSLAAVTLADTGAYTVVVTSTLNGTTTSSTSTAGNLRVNVAPAITAQPVTTQTIVVSTPTAVAFTVAAAAGAGSSAGTLTYQWKKNGANLANGGTVTGATAATLNISAAAITDSGTYTVVITRTLNGTTTTTTSGNSRLEQPVAIMPDAFVIRVNGQERPYAFQLPAGTTTERLTLSILDAWGRRVWSESVNPAKDKLTEVSWNGKSANGRLASAGMYIVRIQVLNGNQTTTYIRKSVTLKPR